MTSLNSHPPTEDSTLEAFDIDIYLQSIQEIENEIPHSHAEDAALRSSDITAKHEKRGQAIYERFLKILEEVQTVDDRNKCEEMLEKFTIRSMFLGIPFHSNKYRSSSLF